MNNPTAAKGGKTRPVSTTSPTARYSDLDDAGYTKIRREGSNVATEHTDAFTGQPSERVGCRDCQWSGSGEDLVPDIDGLYCPQCGSWEWA